MSHAQNDFSMGRVYPTKVDWWIGLILIFTVAVLIGSAVPFLVGPPTRRTECLPVIRSDWSVNLKGWGASDRRASSGSVKHLHSRGGDKIAAYFANSVAKEAGDDHGRSGEQDVSVTPRRGR